MTSRGRTGLTILALLVVAAASATVTWSVAGTRATSRPSPHVGECIQGQLQVAVEQLVGYGTTQDPLGYTFLIVNIGTTACELRGYPYEIIFSTATGAPARSSVSHDRTLLYAEPQAQRVVLRPGGVASFGLTYFGLNVPPPNVPTRCLATLLDFRLPARLSHLFSYEFLVRPIETCAATLKVDVTPVEGATTPRA